MARIAYEGRKFEPAARHVIGQANNVLTDYAEQGFSLTLRQLYYQFVAHDLFPDDRRWTWVEATKKWVRDSNGTKNAEPNYKWLGDIVNKGRMAGRIDWDAIVDRTRKLEESPHWESPAALMEIAAKQFQLDLWKVQPNYVEVWVEKDALVDVIASVCKPLNVPYFSCRGYTSQSEMWSAAQRLLKRGIEPDKQVTILHLGDHDPSGVDMTRDVEDRLSTFIATDHVLAVCERDGLDPDSLSETNVRATAHEALERLEVRRIALSMEQVRQYGPPPNPAKLTDSRAKGYVREYGNESWELDALEPRVLAALITKHVEGLIDDDIWDSEHDRQEGERELLQQVAGRWDEMDDLLGAE